MRPIVTDVAWSVCLCVCLLVTTVSCVWGIDSAGPSESCIKWGPGSPHAGEGVFMHHFISIVLANQREVD